MSLILPTDLIGIQQVMSQSNVLIKFPEPLKLSGTANFHKWASILRVKVSPLGCGLMNYLDTGAVNFDPSIGADDQMRYYQSLNMFVENLMYLSVSDKLFTVDFDYHGKDLYDRLVSRYGTITLRSRYVQISSAITKLASKSLSASDVNTLIRNLSTNALTGMSIQEFLGMLVLYGIHNPSAEARILDGNLPIDYRELDVSLADIFVASEPSTVSTSTVLATVGHRHNNNNNRKKQICKRCGQKGHISIHCPAPAPLTLTPTPSSGTSGTTTGASSATKPGSHQVWMVNSAVTPLDSTDPNQFWLDSGSTVHLSNNKAHFTTFASSSGVVSGVGGETLSVEGSGTLEFELNGYKFTMSDVLYVPQAHTNLISMILCDRKGAFFTVGNLQVVDNISQQVIGTADGSSLYRFLPTLQAPSAPIALAVTAPDYHARLGHPHPDVLRSLGLPSTPRTTLCPACVHGKTTKTIPKTSTTSSSAPLQLLHADVAGPFPVPGLSTERYFLTIVDDFTRWTHAVPLIHKSDCAGIIKDFVAQVETQFSSRNYQVASIRTDNGGEFCSGDLESFFRGKGIVHQRTVPYNSYQNGVAERKHRTLEEKVRTLLVSSGLPNSFWAEALQTAVFLINRLPSTASKTSPFELWYGFAPDLTILRPFGCKVFALVDPVKRESKFSPATQEGILVGYSSIHKAYNVYLPSTHQIHISNNCRFDESVFPATDVSSAVSVEPLDLPSGSAMYGPAIAAIPGPAAPTPNIPLPQSLSELPEDSSFAPSPSVSIDEGSPSVASSLDSDNFADMSDDDVASDSVPILSIPDAPAVSTPSTTVFDRSVIPSEHGLLPVVPQKRDVDEDDSSFPSPKRHAQFPLPASELKRSLSDEDAAIASDSKRSHLSNFLHTVLFAGAALTSPFLPTTVAQALSSTDSSRWKVALEKEMSAHRTNHTWDLVDLPQGRRAIGCRWVFNIKDSASPPIYKARLVAQGFRQVQGLDYQETFSPVIRYESIRLLFATAAEFHLGIHQMDVTTAFLNGDLDEEIYMNQPDGYVDSSCPDKVCRLVKSLYGLKQAPLCWNTKINSVLETAGFIRAPSDLGIYSFTRNSSVLLLALYVDDLLLLSNDASLVTFAKSLLGSHFSMKDLGAVKSFLGMDVSQAPGRVSICLSRYLSKVLADFNMTDCNPVSVPLSPSLDLTSFSPDEQFPDASRYRSMVGKLLFASNTVRPDLSYAVSVLSRYIKDPKEVHMKAAKQVLRYVKGTLDAGLLYRSVGSFQLIGYCDADWANDKSDRASNTGYVFKLSDGPISWRSKKQATVAQSSTEAEYLALGDAVRELLWLKQLLNQLPVNTTGTPILYEDNNGCILLAGHPVFHSRTKHIDVRHHFLRQHLADGSFELIHVGTNHMAADMLTKPLAKVKFAQLCELLGVKTVAGE